MSLFVDANVPMYAEGRDHPFKGPSAAFMMAVARRQVDAVSDVEVLQEILHRYRAVGRPSVDSRMDWSYSRRSPPPSGPSIRSSSTICGSAARS